MGRRGNVKGQKLSMSGWDLRIVNGRRFYLKGNYIIRQLRFSTGAIVPYAWEVVVGDRVVALERTRKDAKDVAERMMGQ